MTIEQQAEQIVKKYSDAINIPTYFKEPTACAILELKELIYVLETAAGRQAQVENYQKILNYLQTTI